MSTSTRRLPRFQQAWALSIKHNSEDNSITQKSWATASKTLRKANAYYFNDKKAIATIEAEDKAYAEAEAEAEAKSKAKAAKDAQAWSRELESYLLRLAPEQREDAKKEIKERGPQDRVWYRKGDLY